jgi:ABC-type Na+ efflux pump permease subunit
MPNSTGALTYFLSYFPPSAPIALMLRGVFGNLPTWEFWLGLADIVIFGALAARLATYIFCRNAIEFTPKINFKKLFSNPRKSWKK